MKKGVKKLKNEDYTQDILDLRLKSGYTYPDILQYLKEKGLSQASAYRALQDAKDKLNEIQDKNFSDSLWEDIQRFEKLYMRSIGGGNLKEARENLKEISKLKGHYEEKIKINGSIEHTISVIKLIAPPDDKNDNE